MDPVGDPRPEIAPAALEQLVGSQGQRRYPVEAANLANELGSRPLLGIGLRPR